MMHPEKDILIWEREYKAGIIVKGNMLPKIDNEDFVPDELEKLKAFMCNFKKVCPIISINIFY